MRQCPIAARARHPITLCVCFVLATSCVATLAPAQSNSLPATPATQPADPNVNPFAYQGRHPVFFPDGTFIRGVQTSAGGELWHYDLATGQRKPVTTGPDAYGSPALSPDARQLLAAHQPANKNVSHISRMNIDGRLAADLTAGQVFDTSPAYTPDGKSIVFARASKLRPYSMGGTTWDDWDLWVTDADGGRPSPLTTQHYRGIGSLTISPDGKTILFSADLAGGNAVIYTMPFTPDAPGLPTEWSTPAAPTKIKFPYDCDPAFSPDGKHVAFISSRTIPYDYEVWIADPDGGNPTQITHDNAYNEFPAFDPTGRFIVYSCNPDRMGPFAFIQIGADGKNRRDITNPSPHPSSSAAQRSP